MSRAPGLRTDVGISHRTKITQHQIIFLKLVTIGAENIDEVLGQEMIENPALEMVEGMEEAPLSFSEREMKKEERDNDDIDHPTDLDLDGSDHEMGDIDSFGDEMDFHESYDDLHSSDHSEIPETSFEQEYLRQYMDDDPYGYAEAGQKHSQNEDEKHSLVPFELSFHDHLMEQVELMELQTETQRIIAEQIVGTIDSQGYLTRDFEGIIKDIRAYHGIAIEKREIVHVLQMVQRFDPPGTGARDLRDCLLIQLRLLASANGLRPSDREKIEKAYLIIDEHFEEFKKKHYGRMQRALGLKKEQDLEPYLALIRKLNPKPASGFSTRDSGTGTYITPDFIIEQEDEDLKVVLHARNAPELRVSDAFQEQLRGIKEKRTSKMTPQDQEVYTFIKSKIDSARWFIDAIKQRQDTMLRTMGAILAHQYEYFRTGDARKMRPMILKDISDVTNLDISTISRVANSKFVQTEFGTKRIKEFFSESLQNDDGEEVSTLEVKEIMKEIIAKEPQMKPLSDEKIRSMLQKKGYPIARRTVAKYRESLNIPVARMRKVLLS
jgi:RNA polymerase sigma-54 factor